MFTQNRCKYRYCICISALSSHAGKLFTLKIFGLIPPVDVTLYIMRSDKSVTPPEFAIHHKKAHQVPNVCTERHMLPPLANEAISVQAHLGSVSDNPLRMMNRMWNKIFKKADLFQILHQENPTAVAVFLSFTPRLRVIHNLQQNV